MQIAYIRPYYLICLVLCILLLSMLLLAVVSSTHTQYCSSVFSAFFSKSGDLPPYCSSDNEGDESESRANRNIGTEQQQQTSPSKCVHRAVLSGAGGGGVALPQLTRATDAGALLQAMNSINRCFPFVCLSCFFMLFSLVFVPIVISCFIAATRMPSDFLI